MDDYKTFENISRQPHSTETLALMMAATRIAQQRFVNCPPSMLFASLTHFPSRQDAANRTAAEPFQDLMAPVDDAWIRYADRISRSPCPSEESNVTTDMWNLVRGCALDSSIVERYLELLRATSLHTEIAPIRILRQDENIIDTEGVDRPTIIPFLDGRDWAFAIAYSDCIHWYDSRPDRQTPSFHASGARRVVEGWKGPQHTSPDDAGVFMLFGIRLILQHKPHLSQRAADAIAQSFRTRMLVELLADKIEPTAEDLLAEGIVGRMEIEEESIFVSPRANTQSPAAGSEMEYFRDALYMRELADRAARSTSSMPPRSSPVDEIVRASARREPNMPRSRPWPRQMDSVEEEDEAQLEDELFQDEMGSARGSTPALRLNARSNTSSSAPRSSLSSTANSSQRRKASQQGRGAQDSASDTTRETPDSSLSSLINREVILENLATALRFKRSAIVSDRNDERILWSLGQDNMNEGKLQQRYSRVLFNEKMEGQMKQDCEMNGVSDREWEKMKRDFRNWKVWKDIRDIGLEHDDLGQFVTLCAFPGSMNSGYKPRAYCSRLISDFKREIEKGTDVPSSFPLRQWLGDARQLCDAILSGPLPTHRLNIDSYDSKVVGEITDDNWGFYTSMDLAS